MLRVPCGEKDCTEFVTWDRVGATVRTAELVGDSDAAEGFKSVTVYLTCPLQHTHPYRFEVPDGGDPDGGGSGGGGSAGDVHSAGDRSDKGRVQVNYKPAL